MYVLISNFVDFIDILLYIERLIDFKSDKFDDCVNCKMILLFSFLILDKFSFCNFVDLEKMVKRCFVSDL